jgi:ATP-dependent RNA helicase SUPV3L1/SUV3
MRTQAAKPYSKLVAVLGPTNTGKTHRAIGRMLEHPSGMLGLPLRLLAREVYDRLTREIGEHAVALVTGEEKRIGRRARYWICTVEAMPMSQEVDFLAVDEIQLAAHPWRGHVFTDRLLHARGRVETWFMGADTMRPLLRMLIPTVSIESQPRFSKLAARGQSRLAALPARSAVVAFSVPEVYRLAERLRHRRGGAAVVLGALSPRARNAQVALYEAGEVDYLVATDAIGMGLNLGICHVAFAGLEKFDGREERLLSPAELAQIAGRAGRHLQNGTFGTLAPLPALPQGLERCIEEHRFENVRQLTWRNHDLCTESLPELLASLRMPSPRPCFSRLSQSSDMEALERLEADTAIRQRARGQSAVQLLWQTCQIPDFRNWVPELHADLVKQTYLQLTGPSGVLDEDWLASSIQTLDDMSGDIDALTSRLSSLRTWTYLSNHPGWISNVDFWVQRTRDLEDRLSDVLHERLVQRFVERSRHKLVIEPKAAAPADADLGQVKNPLLALQQIRENMFGAATTPSIERWVEDLAAAPHQRFVLDASGTVSDADRCLGRLSRGQSLLRPEVKLSLDGLSSGQQLRLSRRLMAWSRDLVQEVVGRLRDTPDPAWSPAARGLMYQLEQNLGSLPASTAGQQLLALSRSDRESFAKLEIELGREVIYSAEALKPRQRLIRLLLAQAFSPRDVAALPLLRRVSFQVPAQLSAEWLIQVGFLVIGTRALRVDMLARISRELRQHAQRGAFALPTQLAQWLGCNREELSELLIELGYRAGDDGLYRPLRERRSRRKRAARAV